MQKEIGVGVCEYHIFDMGDHENDVPPELKRAYFHRWGLEKQTPPSGLQMFGSSSPAEGKEYYGLYDTIKLLGHEQLDVIDVFVSKVCHSCTLTSHKTHVFICTYLYWSERKLIASIVSGQLTTIGYQIMYPCYTRSK